MTMIQGKTCRVCGDSGGDAFYRNRGGSVCKVCTRKSNNVCRDAHKDTYNATRRSKKERQRSAVVCQRCGQPAQRQRIDAKYCLTCSERAARESKNGYAERNWRALLISSRDHKRRVRAARPPFRCKHCGTECKRTSNVQRYCDPCEHTLRLARQRSYHVTDIRLGAQVACALCDASFTRVGSAQRVCPSCAPALRVHHSLRHRARKLGATGTHTKEQFRALCEASGWACSYCSRPLTRKTATEDHIVPLIKGGGNDIANIAPSCRSCNSSKGSKTLEEFGQRRTA